MMEEELQQKIHCWTGTKSPSYGALLHDLASLKLAKGDVSQAQSLFQQALLITPQSAPTVPTSSEAEEDWESSWESSLQQLQQQRQVVQKKPHRKPTTSAVPKQQGKQLSQATPKNDDAGPPDEPEVPYDGSHVLECHSMSQHASVLKLEGFLAKQPWQSVAPVVRPVTDTHAVVVCTNPADARALLQQAKQESASWQFKPFSQACKQCQAVNATELQPPQLRQKTTTAVARRLIGNALNVAGVHDKAAEQQLKAQRAAGKEAKAEKLRQLAATWEDD